MISCAIFFLTLVITLQAQNVPRIALVDYRPLVDPSLTPTQRLEGNCQNYLKILESITKNATSEIYFVVFPDSGLHYGLEIEELNELAAPVIEPEDILCFNETLPKFLRDLSCAARDYGTSLLVNIVEKAPECDILSDLYRNCRNFDNLIFTTTILLNQTGHVDQRHRKYYKNYVFAEEYFDNRLFDTFMMFPIASDVNESIATDDDYYGVFVSGDIFADHPSRLFLSDIIYLKHFVYPTSFEWEFPFLTPIQVGQMWAQGYGVALLTSAVNLGSGGTGIYTDDGIIQPETVVAEESTAFVYNYPPKNSEDVKTTPVLTTEEIDNLAKAKDDLTFSFDETIFESSLSVFVNGYAKICSDDFCCELNPVTSGNSTEKSYTYRLVAFRGLKSFTKNMRGFVEICAVVACLDSTIKSCGKRFPKYEDIEWPLTFQEITIKATSKSEKDKVFFPNSLLSSLTPIDPKLTNWEVCKKEGFNCAIFSTREAQNRLLVFSIFGLNYDVGIYEDTYNPDIFSATTGPSTETETETTTTEKPNSAARVLFDVIFLGVVLLIFLK